MDPLITAGPIVRRVVPTAATVWVALRRPAEVTLVVFEDQAGQPGAERLRGSRRTVALGPNLHVVAVTATGPALAAGREYLYDLEVQTDGGSGHLGDAGVLVEDPAVATDVQLLRYPGRALPGLRCFAERLDRLRFAHGSCRKAHGKGDDALAHLDRVVADALSGTGGPVPQGLFLTGDQIYADDVHPVMLDAIHRRLPALLGEDRERKEDLAGEAARLAPGERQSLLRDEARFTSGAASCHLVTFAEYVAMYLFAWSDVPWRGVDLAGVAELRAFRRALPRVRRVLANVPTWMMFDDHDVTDDWNRTGAWVGAAGGAPLGRRIVRNALAAYALCQHWGNTPEDFAGEAPGAGLLTAVEGWAGLEAGAAAVEARVHVARGAADVAGVPAGALRWDWSFVTPLFRVLAPDCRTRRHYPSPEAPAGLVSVASLDELLAAQPARPFTVLIAPTPILGEGTFDFVQRAAVWIDRHRPWLRDASSLGDVVDCESWVLHPPTWKALIERLAAAGPSLVLSGDVHYGYAATVRVEGVQQAVVNLCASSLHNRSFPGLLMRLLQAQAVELESPGAPNAPPPAFPELAHEVEVGERSFREEMVAPDTGDLFAEMLEAPLPPKRGDVLGEPQVGDVVFPEGEVEQRLWWQEDNDEALEVVRHRATFRVGGNA